MGGGLGKPTPVPVPVGLGSVLAACPHDCSVLLASLERATQGPSILCSLVGTQVGVYAGDDTGAVPASRGSYKHAGSSLQPLHTLSRAGTLATGQQLLVFPGWLLFFYSVLPWMPGSPSTAVTPFL